MTTFSSIKQLTSNGSYNVNMSWEYLFEWIAKKQADDSLAKLDIDPPFQRAHVWTKDKQIAYVEHILQGGGTSGNTNTLRFNCVGWMNSFKGPFVLVDGKQRLEAVRRFMENEIPAFGHYYNEYEDRLPSYCEMIINVNNLTTYREVLNWYLEINTGGVVHTPEEIQKVRDMLDTLD